MTRKEIEKRCREEMQQNISDKNALWAKIESNLPEQQPAPQQKPQIRRSVFHRTMAAAACFLFVAAGLSLWSNQKRMETAENTSEPATFGNSYQSALIGDEENVEGHLYDENNGAADDEADAAEAEAPADDAFPEAANTDAGMLTYADLAVPHEPSIAGEINTQLLSAEGEYFSETDVLAKTDCFVDVIVTDASQYGEDEIRYELEVLDIYGDTPWISGSLHIISGSPYLLETGHEYVLPLSQNTESSYALSYSCAPQIERTKDGKFLAHNGWYSLMTESSEPVLCDSYGADDFFFDRMYLTGYTTLEAFLQKWEEGTL